MATTHLHRVVPGSRRPPLLRPGARRRAAIARLRDAPLLGIVGPSGVGKSSFVRAGVVPALKASGKSWSTLVVRPGRSPMAALAYALTPMVSTGTGSSTNASTVSADLSQQQAVVERLYGCRRPRCDDGYLIT